MKRTLLLLTLSLSLVAAAGCGIDHFKNVNTGRSLSTDDPGLSSLYNSCRDEARSLCPECRSENAGSPCSECMEKATAECMREKGWVPCGLDCRLQGVNGP